MVDVRERGLVASFAAPNDRPFPGVLVLGGSEGGSPAHVGELLAAAGFASLALSYFHAPGVPANLVEIPVEYVHTAIQWLRDHPQVRGDRIGVVGWSKGAELALIAATRWPDWIGTVVAYAPSSVAFAGIAFRGDGRRRSSWSEDGKPLPFVPYPTRVRPSIGVRGLSLAAVYRAALENTDAVARAAIPIERADADILLISGGRDRMWPSTAMAATLIERLTEAGKRDRVEHLHFDDAGHSFMPWAPAMRSKRIARLLDQIRLMGVGGLFDLGGRPRANREALHNAWPRAVAFLTEHLK